MSAEELAQLQRQVQRERTARKEAERLLEEKSLALYRSNQQLQISVQKYQLLFENSRDALMTLAPPSWKFTRANQATVQLFGASSEAEFTALGPWEVSPQRQPDGRLSSEKAQEMIATAMRVGSHFLEWEHQRLDGQPFPADVLLTRMEVGEEVFLQATVRDITARKRMEKQVVEQYEHVAQINTRLTETNQQLKQAQSQLLQSEKMASIGLLAAGVAHEINNPIGYVNSNLGTLKKYLANLLAALDRYEAAEAALGADNPLVEELRQFKKQVYLERIRKDINPLIAESQLGLERVKKIVLDLKNFARTESEDQWALADVHQCLDSTLNVVWNELKYKCEVVKEYAALPDIQCLPSQLNQVFMNLLVNAAQAIEERGTITLRSGQEGERIWVEVSDTGKGIPPENLPRLFDPFFTTKPVGKGTGLGLSVSYNIVEKHHGRIEVRSETGKGSTFRVWLPVRQPATKEAV